MAAVVWEDDRGLTEDGVDSADFEVFWCSIQDEGAYGTKKTDYFYFNYIVIDHFELYLYTQNYIRTC